LSEHPSKSEGKVASSDWLDRYPGGWQILIAEQGVENSELYGEASLAAWKVEEYLPSVILASLKLTSSPLSLIRRIEVKGSHVHISDTVENLSSITCQISWVSHPAFGAPLLEVGSKIVTDAKILTLEPGRWPYHPESEVTELVMMKSTKADIDLSVIPELPRDLFATLSGFADGCAAIINDRLDIGVLLSWDLEIFPHLWFWQDLKANQESPWLGRAYVTAIEPSNHKPQSAGSLEVLPNSQVTTSITLSVFNNVKDVSALEDVCREARNFANY
jgi:hypothetical protein